MKKLISLTLAAAIAAALTACATPTAAAGSDVASAPAQVAQPAADTPAPASAAQTPDVSYTLKTSVTGSMHFVGVGGDIDGQSNPTLTADPGDTVSITLINGDGVTHDLTIDEFNVTTGTLDMLDQQQTITFTADQAGTFAYYCSQPGHRAAGMEGKLIVGEPQAQAATGANIVRNPSDLPGPVGDRAPETVTVNLVAQEVEGQLADGTTMTYFTFNGQVPGPMIRVRVGDLVELHLKNDTSSKMAHSIDLHAVTGPGGGAVYTSTAPGEETVFTFKTLKPGLFVYHCATPSVAEHIANGMYGMILVEPEGGLPPVDKEFYVMQGEIYTTQPRGTLGHVDFSMDNMLDERPTYFVFNGAANALAADDNALRASVGDTVRIYFGVGGPNFTSSFHVIGEIFDKAYLFGSLSTPPMLDVQTITVPPGDAGIVEFQVEVPGRYILVDHALSRLEEGLVGFLYAEGADNPDVFHEGPAQ